MMVQGMNGRRGKVLNKSEQDGATMDEMSCIPIVGETVNSLRTTVEELKRCMFSGDKKRMKDVVKTFYNSLNTSLPLFDKLVAKAEKSPEETKLLSLLPWMQQLGSPLEDLVGSVQATVEAEVCFTDKAVTEISEIMGLVSNLARDTRDALTSGNEHFKEYAISESMVILDRIRDFGIEHQQRIVIGLCMPKASFLYLDIMNSLKRITMELSGLFERI
jgi:Na+/phosphate symporter